MTGVALPDCPKVLSLLESSTGLLCTLIHPQVHGYFAHERARPSLGPPQGPRHRLTEEAWEGVAGMVLPFDFQVWGVLPS